MVDPADMNELYKERFIDRPSMMKNNPKGLLKKLLDKIYNTKYYLRSYLSKIIPGEMRFKQYNTKDDLL
ncbi:MAG: hypothetical protein ABH811_01270 [archaeon]